MTCYCLPVTGSQQEISITIVSDQDVVVASPHSFKNADAIVPERYQYPVNQGPENLDKSQAPETLTGGSGHITAGSASVTALLAQDNHPLVIGRGKHLPANQIVDIVIQLVFMMNAADVDDSQGSKKTLVPQDVDMSGNTQELDAELISEFSASSVDVTAVTSPPEATSDSVFSKAAMRAFQTSSINSTAQSAIVTPKPSRKESQSKATTLAAAASQMVNRGTDEAVEAAVKNDTSRVQHLITTAEAERKSWLSMYAPGFSKAEINDEFYLFDWDDDKHITPGELGKVMQELGLDPTAEMVYNVIRHFDQDHSGSVTRGQEFYKMMLTRHSQHDEALDSDNMQTFDLLDADGDSKISGDEMRAVYAKLERRSNDLPASELSDDAINDMLQKCPSKLWLPLKFMDYNRLSMQFLVHVFNPMRIQKLDKGQLDYDVEDDKTQ